MAQRLNRISITGHPIVLDNARWTEHAHWQGNSLPTPPTPMIGREQEQSWAVAALTDTDTRLVTIHGMGGVGKTRLSLAIGTEMIERFPDGVFFIPLQHISEDGLLPSAISQALEIYTLPGESALEALIAQMRDMNALLILDNFEQLISSAPTLATLLSACPMLKLLVTSREVLNLRGEQLLLVQPLPLPNPKHKPGDIAAIETSPAVRLFVQRARSAKASFALDAGNAEAVAEICARLDGLPLAIELAAARIRFLSPAALVARLQKRLQLLTGGAADLPLRQQTLRNVIAWSYDLLTPGEQWLFRVLSVFSSCTLEAAQEVCDTIVKSLSADVVRAYGDLDLLNVATSLANKSLIRVIEADDEPARLAMLETVREYAAEQLSASAEAETVRAAHAHFVRTLSEEAEAGLKTSGQVMWLDRLEKELGNIRHALEWSTEKDPDGKIAPARVEAGLAIAGALGRFWNGRGHLKESSDWFDLLIPEASGLRTPLVARAMRAAGRIEFLSGNLEKSRRYYEEALEIARELKDDNEIALALVGIGNVVWEMHYTDVALAQYKQCLEIWTRVGNYRGVASASNNIGLVLLQDDPQSAQAYLERAVQLYRQQGDVELRAISLDSLGQAYLNQKDLERAEKCLLEALTLDLQIGEQWNIAYNLVSWGRFHAAREDFSLSVRCMAAANATYDNLRHRLEKPDYARYTACLDADRAALGDAAYDVAWAEGMKMSPGQLLGIFVGQSSAAPQPAPIKAPAARMLSVEEAGLSSREVEVLVLLAQGLSNGEVAEKLFLSLYTVNAHLRNIYRKLDITSRTAATRFAVANGLL